jgi:hypothetical protein
MHFIILYILKFILLQWEKHGTFKPELSRAITITKAIKPTFACATSRKFEISSPALSQKSDRFRFDGAGLPLIIATLFYTGVAEKLR